MEKLSEFSTFLSDIGENNFPVPYIPNNIKYKTELVF